MTLLTGPIYSSSQNETIERAQGGKDGNR
jgi:hypothetical protein